LYWEALFKTRDAMFMGLKYNNYFVLYSLLQSVFGVVGVTMPQQSIAQNTSSLKKSAPLYQNGFDLASGGASLTRATQEGVIFANPSLIPIGEGIWRSFYGKNTFAVSEGSLNIVKSALESTSGSTIASNILQNIFDKPAYLNNASALGLLTSYVGVAGLSSVNFSMYGEKFGSIGLPELSVKSNSYAGVVLSAGTTLSDYLSIGISPKYIYNTQIDTTLSVGDLSDLKQGLNKIKNSLTQGNGIATDLGVTLQLRSKHFDVRVAGVLTDFGNTTFSGSMPPWLQTYHAGLGLTLHDNSNALHCAVDYRDLTNVYNEPLSKKMYMGCKLIIAKWVAFGYGMRQGWPSYGMVLNLFVARIEAGTYTTNLSASPGLPPSAIYFLTLGYEL
jgi:hypothetical protein